MPRLNGYGVVRALQAQADTARIPVAFVTAEHDLGQRVNAFRFGVVEYITKPLRPERLIQTLDSLFERLGNPGSGRSAERAGVLLADVRRDARTGTLTVPEGETSRRVVLRAGDVVDGEPPPGDETAEFEELDFEVEDLLAHDPSQPVDDGATPPDFADIPQALRRVLLVDDNQRFRGLLAHHLSACGFRVLETEDAEGARVLVQEEWPWLVVTDTRLPGADGFELCRRIRSCPCHARLPVLFLSGWHDSRHRAWGESAGGDHFLSKQTPVGQILVRMRMILSRFTALLVAEDEAVETALDHLGVLSVLRLLHLRRQTGILTLRSGDHIIEVRWREGEIVGADSETSSGPEALAEALPWRHGELNFESGSVEEAVALGSFRALLSALCRRLCNSA